MMQSVYNRFQISKRSVLYSLEPIAKGTSQTEGLLSYICRLAEEHSVSPKSFFNNMLLPRAFNLGLLKGSYKYNRRSLRGFSGYTADGIGDTAQAMATVVEELTGRKDIVYSTLLPYSKVFSQIGFLRQTRAWCPYCLYEHNVEYNPLIWRIASVKVCQVHKVPLVTKCPTCHRENFDYQQTQLGHCRYCHGWLGMKSEKEIVLSESSVDYFEYWVSATIGEIIAKAPSLLGELRKEKLVVAIVNAVEVLSGGNIADFARRLGFSKTTVWSWHRGCNTPSLPQLLKICYYLNISLWDFLTEGDSLVIKLVGTDPLGRKSSKAIYHPVSRRINVEEVKSNFDSIRSQIPPKSLAAIVAELGVDRKTLYKHFPVQCEEVNKKYHDYRNINSERRISEGCSKVTSTVFLLHSQGKRPTRRLVAQHIGLDIRGEKHLYQAWQDAMRKIGRL